MSGILFVACVALAFWLGRRSAQEDAELERQVRHTEYVIDKAIDVLKKRP